MKTALILAFLFVSFTVTSIYGQNSNESLQDVFNPSSCQRTCWLGIQPGITSDNELRVILDNYDLEYSISSIDSTLFYSVVITDISTFPFVEQDIVSISVSNSGVYEIYIPLRDVLVSTVIDEFGAPTRVLEKAIPDSNEKAIEIIYDENNIIFLRLQNIIYNMFIVYIYRRVTCSTISILSCRHQLFNYRTAKYSTLYHALSAQRLLFRLQPHRSRQP